MMHTPSNPERVPQVEQLDLLAELLRYEPLLNQLAKANKPLTMERLSEIAPDKLVVAKKAVSEGLGWPDADSALELRPKFVELFDDSLNPSHADEFFGHEIFVQKMLIKMDEQQRAQWLDSQVLRAHHEGIQLTDDQKSELLHQRGFNNFSMTLSSAPRLPDASTNLFDNAAIHGSKPYLLRAHKLMPEFIDAMQSEVRRAGGHAGLNDTLLRGYEFPEENPREAILLRASRLSYGLMVNLMCRDDVERQAIWLGLDPVKRPDIKDSHTELWT